MAYEPTGSVFVRFLQRSRPLRGMPVWQRYAITTGIVLVFFGARYALSDIYPNRFLLFLPAILFASFVFDRGSGFFATFLATLLALLFFVEPRDPFQVSDIGKALSVVVFCGVGILSAAIIEALRRSVEELADKQRELGESMTMLETIIEGTPDPIYVKDRGGRYVRVNSVLASNLGAPAKTLIGKRDRDLLPLAQAERIESVDRVVMQTRSPFHIEEQIDVAGQGSRWFLSTKAPWYGPDGTLAGIIGISRDIDERKHAEEEVRAANRQKDLLLYDINHRVKNHLQSVMATLSMSRRRMPDASAREALDATITRLSVLARVYDRLELRPGGEAVVSARGFIEGLCEDLRPAVVALRPIDLSVAVDEASIPLGRAVSVGLVINEALANALKHGFPDNRAGSVAVTFRRERDGFVLTVADDGVGLSPERENGTGLRLISAIAQQLAGAVTWEGPPGTRLTLRFPAEARDRVG